MDLGEEALLQLNDGGVGAQVVDHHLNGHGIVIGMPAVVVGHHRQGAVGDFGFTR